MKVARRTNRLISMHFSVVCLAGFASAGCDDGPVATLPDGGAVDAHVAIEGPDHGIDSFDPRCTAPTWTPGACAPGMGTPQDPAGQQHIPDDQAITYALSPPATGNHRGAWARWGAYTTLPPQRWLHNLEHGGVVFLYHPCTSAEEVARLQAIVDALPEDARWILTPYPDLPAAIGVVAWGWSYLASCVQPDEITTFFEQHEGMGPEDVAADGAYDVSWLGR